MHPYMHDQVIFGKGSPLNRRSWDNWVRVFLISLHSYLMQHSVPKAGA